MGNVVLDYSQIFEKVSTLAQLRAYSVIGVKTGDPLLVVGTTAPADGGGGLYVWDALSRAPDNNTSVIKPNSILNEGRWVSITLPMALPPIPPPPPVKYSVPFGFTTPLRSEEIILIHVFALGVVFPSNWSGALATVGINPLGSVTLSINRNGSQVGSIVVSSSGDTTFTSTGEITFQAGDVLTITAPENPDTTLENTAFTLLGTVEED